MRQAGELSAEDELAWADKEEDPKEIPVADMGELIRCRDVRVVLGVYDRFSSRKEVRERTEGKSTVSPSQDSPKSATAEPEAEKDSDSIPPDHDLKDDAGREHGEETVPLANDHAETAATANTQLEEPMQVDEVGEKSPEKGTDQLTRESAASPSIDSPFHPVHYPSPWPFIPCTYDDPPPMLEQRIPLHLLPQKIHVHDPWNRLSIDEGDMDMDTPWLNKVTEGRDIVRTYSLSLSDEGKCTALAAQKKAELEEDEAAAEEKVMRIFPAAKEGLTDEQLIEIVLPPRPRKRTQVEEAHLYFAPPAVGKGNHSFVYFAEWELPRDLFVQAQLCRVCVEEDAGRQLQELKAQSIWEEFMKGLGEKLDDAPGSGLDVSSGSEPSHAESNRTVGHVTIEEHHLPHETVAFVNANDLSSEGPHNTSTSDGKAAADNVEAVATSEASPPASTASPGMEIGGTEADVEMDVVEEQDLKLADNRGSKEASVERYAPGEGKEEGEGTLEQDNGYEDEADEEQSEEEQIEEEIFTIQPPRVVRIAAYSGPTVRIHTTVKWQESSGTKCVHGGIGSSNPVPRTATVGVVAKLSIEHDAHLEREAKNYQQFPSHFFEHWNGYNVIPPLHDPVPVGALCPQFYGYYVPDDPTDGTSRPDYLSPILLLEHCGSEIVPEELNEDDKQECASLLFRFHHAGWLHESFAQRNLLWQQGRPTEWPIQRPYSQHKSFRLIDFGRSKMMETSYSRMNEEEEALRLFHLHHHHMTA
jgi:hypothetical protein